MTIRKVAKENNIRLLHVYYFILHYVTFIELFTLHTVTIFHHLFVNVAHTSTRPSLRLILGGSCCELSKLRLYTALAASYSYALTRT